MLTANGMALLGLSGVLACLALLLKGWFAAPRVLLLLAAALFGASMGWRAALTDSPLPAALRFAAVGSFGSVAFHRSWCWIRQKLA